MKLKMRVIRALLLVSALLGHGLPLALAQQGSAVWIMTDEPPARRIPSRGRVSLGGFSAQLRLSPQFTSGRDLRTIDIRVHPEHLWGTILREEGPRIRRRIRSPRTRAGDIGVASARRRRPTSAEVGRMIRASTGAPNPEPEHDSAPVAEPVVDLGFQSGQPDPGLQTAQFGFLDSMVDFFRDFIRRFESENDRGFANVRSFRVQFEQQFAGNSESNPRYFLHIEGAHFTRATGSYISTDSGGVGVRIDGNPDDERRLTLSLTAMPIFGEIRNLRRDGRWLGNDILIRASAAGSGSYEVVDGVEPGFYVSFQPQWKDFGQYRVYYELFVKLRLENRIGNDQYYMQDIVFIPRFVHMINTDGPVRIEYNQDDPSAPRYTPEEELMVQQPPVEWIFMGNLSFRFSL